MQKDYIEIRDYLRKARISAGYSQHDLAEKLGYTSAQFISNWERGTAKPPIKISRKLISILKLNTEVFIDLFIQGTGRKIRRELRSRKL